MLIHLLGVGLRVTIARPGVGLLLVKTGVHQHNLTLKLLIVTLEGVLLSQRLLDGHDELASQLVLLVQIGNLVDAVVISVLIHVVVVIRR
jgi:hypothetical protein